MSRVFHRRMRAQKRGKICAKTPLTTKDILLRGNARAQSSMRSRLVLIHTRTRTPRAWRNLMQS
jgi:hypothetical protein